MNDHAVTRFAPSPTGHLHVGGARTALFCWAFAKKTGGRFMIRIEDTDQARSSDESARGILDDLAWLGITWDDGPVHKGIGANARDVGGYFQARRVPIYNAYIEALVKSGRAYPAFESSAQLDAWRKEAATKKATFKYPRPADVALGEYNENRWKRAQQGEPHVIRFVMPPHGIRVADDVLGEVKFAAGEVDDFVIRKQDGFPTYHFAVVVDDELMGVTHVLRAQEHLINTPKHVALQQAMIRLDNHKPFRTPVYAHMPLICNMDGSKMSKRDKAKAARKAIKDAMAKAVNTPGAAGFQPAALAASMGLDEKLLSDFIAAENDSLDVAEAIAKHFNVPLPEIEVWDYRASGYLPEAIVNFLGLLGWSTGMKAPDGKDVEKFDAAFLAKHFSIERIGKTSAKFDRVKLLSFNGDYIAALSDDDFASRLRAWADEYDAPFAARLRALPAGEKSMLMKMAKPRCKTLRDATKVLGFALVADDAIEFDPVAVEKNLKSGGGAGRAVLAAFRERLASMPNADAAGVDALVHALAAERGVKLGDIAQPVRIGITGTTVSPPLGEAIAALGTMRALARIDRCMSVVR